MLNERVEDAPLPRFVCFDCQRHFLVHFLYRFEQLEYIGRGGLLTVSFFLSETDYR